MRIRDINRVNKRVHPPKRIEWSYVPTPRQLAFHQAKERFRLYGGAMGGGKSVALCAEVLMQSMRHPGNRGYLCRQHVLDVKRSTLITLEKTVPQGVIKRHILDDRTIELWNGSSIVYGGLGNQDEIERIKSTEFGWVAIDEATEVAEEMFQLLASRLRWRLPDGSSPEYTIFCASNPEPGWVKKRFVDSHLADHIFIPALPRDNPHLPPGYNESLREMFPENVAKRYLDGSWDVFEGQIYTEFERDVHVYHSDVFDQQDSRYFERFRVIDHGYQNPTACLWFAVDFDGRLWMYDEHYAANLTIEENAQAIHSRYGHQDLVTLCDPSMFSRTMQHGGKVWSPADEYREQGITCIKPFSEDGKVSEVSGINLVKQRLKHKALFIHENCRNTLDELVAYQWKKLRITDQINNKPEQPVDKNNHAMDALRYACMWRPLNSVKPAKPIPKNSLHYAILRHKQMLHTPFFAGWSEQ